jgi:ATP-binding cassette subfamily C protein
VSQEQTAINAEVIRALGMRRAAVGRHLAERDEMMSLQAQASFAGGGFAAASRFLRTSLQSLALGLGALLAIGDHISICAVFAASFLLGRALAPMDQLVAAWRSMIQARGAYRTIEKLLSDNAAERDKMQLPEPQGRVEVQNLTVLNRTKDAAILADLSLAMNPGEVLAVVGPSGAGKSTLARALAGAIEPDRGCVRIDGANRIDWDQDRLGRHVGYLPQEASLFAGTVKDNIARLSSGAQQDVDAAVVAAAQACGAHDMILRLPNGYDTMLSWGGGGLSAGQAQRIAMARALYGEPSLLVLDEPNAHLDADGEANLLETLQVAKGRGASVMLVAHRMGIMSVVDRIMVISNGRIEAIGPRDEVLEKLKGQTVRSVPVTQRAAR